MEKPAVKPKIKLLKFLPKAASAIRLQNLPYFSPRRNKIKEIGNEKKQLDKGISHGNGSFPRPILSIEQAQDKQKVVESSSFEEKEPTSPKISCMGQIKHKKTLSKKKILLLPSEINPYSSSPFGFKLKPSSVMKPVFFLPAEAKKKQSGVRNCNFTATKAGRKSDACGYGCSRVDRAPSLSQMKRFASCRGGTIANFDWSKAASQIASGGAVEEWRCYSDDEDREYSDGEEEVIFPVSAPTDLKPREEINLWKRRTIDQPKPLQISTLVL